jgi:hypothetical protein
MSEATIKTNKGVYFFFHQPWEHCFDVEEMAYALSYINRFTGHAGAYSVAQHSVMVSYLVPPELAMEGLLHDGAEAYLGDVASPLKQLIRPLYKPLEDSVERELSFQHGLEFPFPRAIKQADLVMLLTEHRDLMNRTMETLKDQDCVHWAAFGDIQPLPRRFFGLVPAIIRWPAWYARYRFVKRYDELKRHGH